MELYQGAANEHGQLLARADTNISRAEPVTISGNPDWGTAGFSLHLPLASLPGGATPLTLAVHTTQHGTWLSTIWLTIPVPDASAPPPDLSPEPAATPTPRSGPMLGPPPRLVVTAPRSGATVSGSYVLQGSAYDPSATASQGTGIDRVEAFLEPDRDGGGRLLGDAVLVPSRHVVRQQPAGRHLHPACARRTRSAHALRARALGDHWPGNGRRRALHRHLVHVAETGACGSHAVEHGSLLVAQRPAGA